MAMTGRRAFVIALFLYLLRFSRAAIDDHNYYRVYEYSIYDYKYNSGEYLCDFSSNLHIPVWLFLYDNGRHHEGNHVERRFVTLTCRRWTRRRRKAEGRCISSRNDLPARLSRPLVLRFVRCLLRRTAVPALSPMILLTLLLLCCGDIESNPGPLSSHHQRICDCCGTTGRKNQIFISCSQCNKYFHRTCSNIMPDAFRRYRHGGKWLCWSCSVPNFSDSFFSCQSNSSVETDNTSVNLTRNIPSGLKFLSFNARSICSPDKHPHVLSLITIHDPDVICVCETWLTSDVPNGFVLPDGYVIYRRDKRHQCSWWSFGCCKI
jgi:hypothetical protein